MCRLSWNLRASIFWKPQGLSRPVMGLLYLYKKKRDVKESGLIILKNLILEKLMFLDIHSIQIKIKKITVFLFFHFLLLLLAFQCPSWH
jgi:hypothetical protein